MFLLSLHIAHVWPMRGDSISHGPALARVDEQWRTRPGLGVTESLVWNHKIPSVISALYRGISLMTFPFVILEMSRILRRNKNWKKWTDTFYTISYVIARKMRKRRVYLTRWSMEVENKNSHKQKVVPKAPSVVLLPPLASLLPHPLPWQQQQQQFGTISRTLSSSTMLRQGMRLHYARSSNKKLKGKNIS